MGILRNTKILVRFLGILGVFFLNTKRRDPKIPRLRSAKWGVWLYSAQNGLLLGVFSALKHELSPAARFLRLAQGWILLP